MVNHISDYLLQESKSGLLLHEKSSISPLNNLLYQKVEHHTLYTYTVPKQKPPEDYDKELKATRHTLSLSPTSRHTQNITTDPSKCAVFHSHLPPRPYALSAHLQSSSTNSHPSSNALTAVINILVNTTHSTLTTTLHPAQMLDIRPTNHIIMSPLTQQNHI